MFKKIVDKLFGGPIWAILALMVASTVWCWSYLRNSTHFDAINAWGIGIGLYGAICGGVCTLVAMYITVRETRKIQDDNMKLMYNQLELSIISDKIRDYKELYENLEILTGTVGRLEALLYFISKDFNLLIDSLGEINLLIDKISLYISRCMSLTAVVEEVDLKKEIKLNLMQLPKNLLYDIKNSKEVSEIRMEILAANNKIKDNKYRIDQHIIKIYAQKYKIANKKI